AHGRWRQVADGHRGAARRGGPDHRLHRNDRMDDGAPRPLHDDRRRPRAEPAQLPALTRPSRRLRPTVTGLTLTRPRTGATIHGERKEVMWSGRCQRETKDPGGSLQPFGMHPTEVIAD